MRAKLCRRLCSLATASTAAVAVLGALMLPGTAHAATAGRGASILAEAETRAGDWYSYGSAGPSAFDCSGLVYWSARQLGISLPRSTYSMLTSSHLVQTWNPVAGDLAFFGTGHVEIVAPGHDVTFGAQGPGTRVGFHTWNGWWHPTAFYRVV